jgi:hypothetical protein
MSVVDAAPLKERLCKTVLPDGGGGNYDQHELQELAALLTRGEEPPDALAEVSANCGVEAADDGRLNSMLSLLTCSEHSKMQSKHLHFANDPAVVNGHISGGLSYSCGSNLAFSARIEEDEDESLPLASKRIVDKDAIASPCSVALITFTPHPAWQYQQHLLLYAAVFLTAESKEVLRAMIPPVHAAVSADHMTLAYKPTIPQLLSLPLGVEVQLKVQGMAADSRAQAVVADPPPWLPPTTSVSTHITISVAAGVQAKEAGFLMRDALQAACEGGSMLPSGVSVPGSYQHLEESLVLIGRVGVELECGKRFFSLKELVEGGVLSCDPSHQQAYLNSHASQLAKVRKRIAGLLARPILESDFRNCYNRGAKTSWLVAIFGLMPH